MAKAAALLLFFIISLSLHSHAREAPHISGKLRTISGGIEDAELSLQIALSLRCPIVIRLSDGCRHRLSSLRVYRLSPEIPAEDFRRIVSDWTSAGNGIREVGIVKIEERWEKGGNDVFLGGFWNSLKSGFQDFYGWFADFQ